MEDLWGPTCVSARVRFLAGGITGGHIGPPLRGVGGVWEPTGIGAERCLSLRGGTEPAPYRGSGGVRGGVWSPRPTGATQVVRSSGPMYLRHGFRRPNFVPKFGAPVMGIGPYGETEKSQQTPGPAAHSGASAARSQGMGGNCGRDHPQRGQQPRTIPQSPSGRQLPLHKGAFGDGGCGSPRRPCGPPRNGNGFLSFRGQCAHWTWESVLFTMDGDPGRRGRRPLRKGGIAAATTQASGAQRSVRARGREGWAGIGAKTIPKGGPPRDCPGSA